MTEEDFITGEELSPLERGLGVLPFGGALAKEASAATDIASMIVRGSDAVNAAERADELADNTRAAMGFYESTMVIDLVDDGRQLGAAAPTPVNRSQPDRQMTRAPRGALVITPPDASLRRHDDAFSLRR